MKPTIPVPDSFLEHLQAQIDDAEIYKAVTAPGLTWALTLAKMHNAAIEARATQSPVEMMLESTETERDQLPPDDPRRERLERVAAVFRRRLYGDSPAEGDRNG